MLIALIVLIALVVLVQDDASGNHRGQARTAIAPFSLASLPAHSITYQGRAETRSTHPLAQAKSLCSMLT